MLHLGRFRGDPAADRGDLHFLFEKFPIQIFGIITSAMTEGEDFRTLPARSRRIFPTRNEQIRPDPTGLHDGKIYLSQDLPAILLFVRILDHPSLPHT
jgi:hypothetical protein